MSAAKSHTVDIPQSIKDSLRKFRFARRNEGSAAIVIKINKQKLIMEEVEQFDNISIEELAEELPENSPRYVILSHALVHSDGRTSFPLVLINWAPTSSEIGLLTLHASALLDFQTTADVSKVIEIREGPEALTSDVVDAKLLGNFYYGPLSVAQTFLQRGPLFNHCGLDESWVKIGQNHELTTSYGLEQHPAPYDARNKKPQRVSTTLRAIASWKAHEDGFLGIEEWENGNGIITHGRDNKLHVWNRPDEISITSGIGGSAALPDLPTPTLRFSLDVNALNYCRFSLLPTSIIGSTLLPQNLPSASTSTTDSSSVLPALIALPNLIESSEADVWSLPSCKRLHAAIGKRVKTSIFSENGRTGEDPTGIIMSLHIFETTSSSPQLSKVTPELRILIAYESGDVTLRRYANIERQASVEGKDWEVIWNTKIHQEAIMALQVSSDNRFALTVSADHIVGRYDLTASTLQDYSTTFRTKHPGNACIAIRDDGRVCAVGGWDGKVRLYSTKSFKPLGTLKYHKDGCQALR
ncbi:WD-40 repeat-containing protein [Lentinula edodes]|uniref:WD-40 repeat-containing protein n=1 Tax=Lentinula edodes TaxID=5353 RepID=A0A1Q3E2P2_LENED|nr:WD-40 repeat-containing protein [Lentinula edodes]